MARRWQQAIRELEMEAEFEPPPLPRERDNSPVTREAAEEALRQACSSLYIRNWEEDNIVEAFHNFLDEQASSLIGEQKLQMLGKGKHVE